MFSFHNNDEVGDAEDDGTENDCGANDTMMQDIEVLEALDYLTPVLNVAPI